jgi:hypothetical protein
MSKRTMLIASVALTVLVGALLLATAAGGLRFGEAEAETRATPAATVAAPVNQPNDSGQWISNDGSLSDEDVAALLGRSGVTQQRQHDEREHEDEGSGDDD